MAIRTNQVGAMAVRTNRVGAMSMYELYRESDQKQELMVRKRWKDMERLE